MGEGGDHETRDDDDYREDLHMGGRLVEEQQPRSIDTLRPAPLVSPEQPDIASLTSLSSFDIYSKNLSCDYWAMERALIRLAALVRVAFFRSRDEGCCPEWWASRHN